MFIIFNCHALECIAFGQFGKGVFEVAGFFFVARRA
jgi:hypothetical protein